MHVLHMIDGLR